MSALESQGAKEPAKAAARAGSLTPCRWALSGDTSVLVSVAAFLIVLGGGIRAAFWTGFGC